MDNVLTHMWAMAANVLLLVFFHRIVWWVICRFTTVFDCAFLTMVLVDALKHATNNDFWESELLIMVGLFSSLMWLMSIKAGYWVVALFMSCYWAYIMVNECRDIWSSHDMMWSAVTATCVFTMIILFHLAVYRSSESID